MKAYKATHNLKCLNQTYEIGKTYTSDTLKICESGFHFCKEMSDVLNYYTFNNNFVLIEVEILGDTQFIDDKGVTDKMKVLRIVPEEEWNFMSLDDKGDRVVNYKNSTGYECWMEYDVNGNVTYHKDSNGYEYWKEYDETGNETHHKDSRGYEQGVSVKN